MDTPTKSLCSLMRNYDELLLQKYNRRRSDQLRLIKLQILEKTIKKHHCKYCNPLEITNMEKTGVVD